MMHEVSGSFFVSFNQYYIWEI